MTDDPVATLAALRERLAALDPNTPEADALRTQIVELWTQMRVGRREVGT